mmetsp:Transcript_10392/g.34400  ORF Transcript_10392/g.34400 Transcript_10392/m.34400 type:complete len:216 (+) Transcript_10392:383-1030(+)
MTRVVGPPAQRQRRAFLPSFGSRMRTSLLNFKRRSDRPRRPCLPTTTSRPAASFSMKTVHSMDGSGNAASTASALPAAVASAAASSAAPSACRALAAVGASSFGASSASAPRPLVRRRQGCGSPSGVVTRDCVCTPPASMAAQSSEDGGGVISAQAARPPRAVGKKSGRMHAPSSVAAPTPWMKILRCVCFGSTGRTIFITVTMAADVLVRCVVS